ncbi:DUF4386 domain-containing protein [Virgisporangium aurantiacum]|uniref:DUF4386 domain-containing protein n=1 Tax=Virgisporangium aurantiacum TaxID=175570 RepID=A0A8J3ZI30_9ACTN|nr:DUF4386 domain-containing protein [Virgisporangium aurantiacum]GIJ63213.1 hypothetical protein Vau01_107290 [Virgisporangium aurantiacum]
MSTSRSGPPLIVPGAAFTVLTIASIAMAAGVPRPTAPAADVLTYVQEHATSMRVSAFLTLGAAVSLAIWAAVAFRRLQVLGTTAPGSAIALAGGLLASAFLALSGLVGWVAARGPADDALATVLRDLTFATGGPGHIAFFGLLLAGVSVPMLLLRIRRPAAVTGLVLAVIAELSTLTLLTLDAAPTLPVARFGGIAWLVAVSLLLPTTRPRTADPAAVRTA